MFLTLWEIKHLICMMCKKRDSHFRTFQRDRLDSTLCWHSKLLCHHCSQLLCTVEVELLYFEAFPRDTNASLWNSAYWSIVLVNLEQFYWPWQAHAARNCRQLTTCFRTHCIYWRRKIELFINSHQSMIVYASLVLLGCPHPKSLFSIVLDCTFYWFFWAALRIQILRCGR